MTTVNNATVFANAFAGCMSGIINSSRAETSLVESQFDSQNQVANLYALEFDAMWALLGPSSPDVFEYEAIESNSASTWYNRNLPDTTTLGTVTQATFTTLCVNIIESILSADALIAAEGVVIPKPSSGGGNGWTTVLDIDFTSLPNQTLGTDGDVTIDGMTWMKEGSSLESAHAAIVNGVGLVFQPSYGTKYTYAHETELVAESNLPFIFLPLEELIPTLSFDTQIRIYVSIGNETYPVSPTDSGGANFSIVGIGTEDLIALCLSAMRGYAVNPLYTGYPTVGSGIAVNLITSFDEYLPSFGDSFNYTFPTSPVSGGSVLGSANGTSVITARGFSPNAITCYLGDGLNAGEAFPPLNEFEVMQYANTPQASFFTSNSTLSWPSPAMQNCGLIIGAGFNQNIDDSGSPYIVTIQRVRIDILG